MCGPLFAIADHHVIRLPVLWILCQSGNGLYKIFGPLTLHKFGSVKNDGSPRFKIEIGP